MNWYSPASFASKGRHQAGSVPGLATIWPLSAGGVFGDGGLFGAGSEAGERERTLPWSCPGRRDRPQLPDRSASGRGRMTRRGSGLAFEQGAGGAGEAVHVGEARRGGDGDQPGGAGGQVVGGNLELVVQRGADGGIGVGDRVEHLAAGEAELDLGEGIGGVLAVVENVYPHGEAAPDHGVGQRRDEAWAGRLGIHSGEGGTRRVGADLHVERGAVREGETNAARRATPARARSRGSRRPARWVDAGFQ